MDICQVHKQHPVPDTTCIYTTFHNFIITIDQLYPLRHYCANEHYNCCWQTAPHNFAAHQYANNYKRNYYYKFQEVLNAAARVIANSWKYERGLTYTRRHELHWLDIPERTQFRISLTVHHRLNGLAPAYLIKHCTPVTHNRSSCHLRSSCCDRLAVPSVKLSIGSHSFSVSGPTAWNALPNYLRNPTLPTVVFRNYLKTFLFAHY